MTSKARLQNSMHFCLAFISGDSLWEPSHHVWEKAQMTANITFYACEQGTSCDLLALTTSKYK